MIPVVRRTHSAFPDSSTRAQISFALEHCHTMASASGWPSVLSQTADVSLWLLIPSPATCSLRIPAFSITSLTTLRVLE